MTVRVLRGGTWNMERDRGKASAAHEAHLLMARHRLDFLLLQECGDYLAALAELPAYRLIRHTACPGMNNTAVLTRADLASTPGYQVRMTRSGWITVRGGHTPAKWMTTVLLDGWLRVGSVHLPVSERWHAGRISGPVRRVAAYVQHARSLVRFLTRHPDCATLIGGDWNARPDDRGIYTPAWIAGKTQTRLVAPSQPTHGRHKVIDYLLRRGCQVSYPQVHDGLGSDHQLVTFTVSPNPDHLNGIAR